MKASRSRFPSDAVCSQSPTVSLKGSLTFPSTVIANVFMSSTRKSEDVALTSTSKSSRKRHPIFWYSQQEFHLTSMRPQHGGVSLGSPPFAHSQQYANVLAENPVRHCLAGSARNRCRSSGPVVEYIAWVW